MKLFVKYLPVILMSAILCFTSCQKEETTVIEPEEEETLTPNSNLVNLMTSITSHDGSVDDVLDNANCFSVNLPVTVNVNGVSVTIDTLEDLEILEGILNEFDDDDDVLEFLFPITIMFNDYSEIVIENEIELNTFVDGCFNQNDDVIECIDFQYPIEFSIFNTDFQIIDTVVV